MQKKFAQPVISIEPKNPGLAGHLCRMNIRFGRPVFVKTQKKIKTVNFTIPRAIIFLLKGLGVAAYAGELSHPLYSLKFTGRLDFENKIKNVGQIFPQSIDEGYYRHSDQATGDQASVQAHMIVGRPSIETTFIDIGKRIFRKKTYVFLRKVIIFSKASQKTQSLTFS